VRPDGWRSLVKTRLEDGLLIEKGRYFPGLAREKRRCPMCDEGVEDAWHMVGECQELKVERLEFWSSLMWSLTTWWNAEVIQKRKTGLSMLGLDSPLSKLLKEQNGWDRVKMLLGGKGADLVRTEEWEIMFTEVAAFCKRCWDKRWGMALEGKGGPLGARVVCW
jgi:hypothetical protein